MQINSEKRSHITPLSVLHSSLYMCNIDASSNANANSNADASIPMPVFTNGLRVYICCLKSNGNTPEKQRSKNTSMENILVVYISCKCLSSHSYQSSQRVGAYDVL